MTLSPLTLIDWELSERWRQTERTRAAEPDENVRARQRCVEFRLRGNRVALPLTCVERLIPRVGPLVPLASGQASIALVGGEPLLAVDLEGAAVSGEPSPLRLEERPALVLPYEGGRIVVGVSGPADLIEAVVDERPLTAHGPLELQGFADGEIPLLRPESVTGWLSQRLGGNG